MEVKAQALGFIPSTSLTHFPPLIHFLKPTSLTKLLVICPLAQGHILFCILSEKHLEMLYYNKGVILVKIVTGGKLSVQYFKLCHEFKLISPPSERKNIQSFIDQRILRLSFKMWEYF